VVAVVLLSLAYFTREALRDLALEFTAGRIPKGIPDSILENISVERTLDAGVASARIGKIERGADWATLYDIDGTMDMTNGQRWTLKAPTGRFFDEKREADLTTPTGTMTGDGLFFNYAAPVASWSQASGRIVFARGFRAWGPSGSLEGQHMELLPEGIVEVSQGAVLIWTESEGERK
jgi:hypothetical protein